MIKLIIWSCVFLALATLGLLSLYSYGAISMMAFAMLSALVVISITVTHIYLIIR